MKDQIDLLLREQQFHKITSNIRQITLYARYGQDSVKVVQLFDYEDEDEISLTKEQYNLFRNRSIEFMNQKGYEDVSILTLILTKDVDECKKYVMDDRYCWMLDTNIRHLVIYENQEADFCGLRGLIDSACFTAGGGAAIDPYHMDIEEGEDANFVKREFTPVNTLLVLINAGIFIYLSVIGSTEDLEFMLDHGVMFVPQILQYEEYYRFFTCMFVHFGFQHLIGNIVVLLFLGGNVERVVGWFKYLLIYIGGGMIGSLGSFLYSYYFNQGIVSAGSSGAIFAVIGALLWLVIRNKGRFQNMTILRVCVMIVYALYSGFTSENIDMAAHLCGLVGGFLFAVALYRGERRRIL